MKLNPDCIRDVLLYLEENLIIENDNEFSQINLYQLQSALNQYDKDDIFYTVYNLVQIRYIEGDFQHITNKKLFYCKIENITYNGHQFLNTIRPKSIWDATKLKAKQIGGMSIQSLSMISMAIMQGLASNPDFIQSIVNNIKQL